MKRALPFCLLLLALTACEGRHDPGPSLQRMIEQPRADVYEASPVFADGKVMQTPPAGTVPRERVLDTAPPPMTPELLEVGRGRFHIYCAVCHGEAGYSGSVVATNLHPRPPRLRGPAVQALPAEAIYQVITNGFGKMPSYASELSVPERWAVVAYVKRLPQLTPRTPAEMEDSARAARFEALSRKYEALKRALPAPPDSTEAPR